MALSWLAVTGAWAGDVSVAAQGETVVGRVVVQAPLAEVVQLLHDLAAIRDAARPDLVVRPIRAEGSCQLVEWVAPHPIKTVQYTGRFCPNATGAEVWLVSSPDFVAMHQVWAAVPVPGGGVEVSHSLAQKPGFYLPQFVIRSETEAAVVDALDNIRKALESRD